MKKKHYVANYILSPQHQLTVDLVGCGGTGSQVLTSLGRMNYALQRLGHPGLFVRAYDGDIITEANCGRQLFSETEIGLNKAEVLITKLNRFFGTDWECVPKMYEKDNTTSNIIVSCVDTLKSRKEIASGKDYGVSSIDTDKVYYWLDFGNMTDRGQVVLGSFGNKVKQPNRGKGCVSRLKDVDEVFDLDKVNERESGPSCSLAEALSKQDLFINSTLANVGCALLWKMFTIGVLDTQGAFLNLENLTLNPIRIS